MTQVIDAQGQDKLLPAVVKGMIIAFYGTRIPEGWALCDGTLGTPNLVGRTLIGDTAVGTGTAGGTEAADTGLTHAGFALAAHADHGVTQNSAHSAHGVTQPGAHADHTYTQPAQHLTHLNGGGLHTHDAHATVATGSAAVATNKLVGPGTHSSDGGHNHDAHPVHTGFAVDAHSAHSATALDAHTAHSGAAFTAHSAHGMTQASNHLYKVLSLAWIFKL